LCHTITHRNTTNTTHPRTKYSTYQSANKATITRTYDKLGAYKKYARILANYNDPLEYTQQNDKLFSSSHISFSGA